MEVSFTHPFLPTRLLVQELLSVHNSRESVEVLLVGCDWGWLAHNLVDLRGSYDERRRKPARGG